jgi:hypothetical protein
MRFRSSLPTENFSNPSSEIPTILSIDSTYVLMYRSDVKLSKLFKNLQIGIKQRNLKICGKDQSKVLRNIFLKAVI